MESLNRDGFSFIFRLLNLRDRAQLLATSKRVRALSLTPSHWRVVSIRSMKKRVGRSFVNWLVAITASQFVQELDMGFACDQLPLDVFFVSFPSLVRLCVESCQLDATPLLAHPSIAPHEKLVTLSLNNATLRWADMAPIVRAAGARLRHLFMDFTPCSGLFLNSAGGVDSEHIGQFFDSLPPSLELLSRHGVPMDKARLDTSRLPALKRIYNCNVTRHPTHIELTGPLPDTLWLDQEVSVVASAL